MKNPSGPVRTGSSYLLMRLWTCAGAGAFRPGTNPGTAAAGRSGRLLRLGPFGMHGRRVKMHRRRIGKPGMRLSARQPPSGTEASVPQPTAALLRTPPHSGSPPIRPSGSPPIQTSGSPPIRPSGSLTLRSFAPLDLRPPRIRPVPSWDRRPMRAAAWVSRSCPRSSRSARCSPAASAAAVWHVRASG